MVPPSRRPDRQRLYLRVRAISPQHSIGRTRPRFSSSRLGPHFEDGLITRGPSGPDLWVVAGGQGRGRCSLCLETNNGKPTSFEGGNIAWLTVHSGHNLSLRGDGVFASSFIPRSSSHIHSPQGRHKLGGT